MHKLKRYLQNLPGTRVNRQLVVIESDDWGSIRMPSAEVYQELQAMGASPESDPYLQYDSLADEEDLCALFEVLGSVEDSKGNPAVLTANTIIGNPDFATIRRKAYQEYHWEPFTETLKRYPNGKGVFERWKEGMSLGVFRPQYHGREHLNVYQWMDGLRSGDEWLHIAFEREMLSVSSQPSKMRFGYMEGLDFFSEEERLGKASILEEGMQAFEALFGYKSLSFIANCYIWDKTAERTLHGLGVKYIQGMSNQIVPVLDKLGTHGYVYKRHFLGDRNELGQRYLVRNAFFEPSLDPKVDWVSDCLKRISIAFQCGKPAIIGSHRLNFIGAIQKENRDQNLAKLRFLLGEIVKRWPKVEFIATDHLDTLWNKSTK